MMRLASSFRDPSGFVYQNDGTILRQVNKAYQKQFDHLTESGLYDELVADRLLVPHKQADISLALTDKAYQVIQPEHVPFISYPYEWSFSQFKDAALSTLLIQKKAMNHGMSLKDASAFNIQFVKNQPLLIDSLSFDIYEPGKPWVAYRQFCQHFLASLALMSYVDVRLNQLWKSNIDGIPLDLASKLLPRRTRFSLSLLTHIHLHAKSQKRYAENEKEIEEKGKVSKNSLFGIIDSLESAIQKMEWRPGETAWGGYYESSDHLVDTLDSKGKIVRDLLGKTEATSVWDIGANTGHFSRIASEEGCQVISFDIDPACVEWNYLDCREKGETNILPLLFDIANPSPAIGWENTERDSLWQRGPADVVLALALIHHLAITNNTPLVNIAKVFARLTSGFIIVEFVPKADRMVQKLLANREDVFGEYTVEVFEKEFEVYFEVLEIRETDNSQRVIYLMKKKPNVA